MNQRFLENETALMFGLDLYSFMERPVAWRCEMMAHLIMKRERERYVAFLQEKFDDEKKRREREASGTNPHAMQMRQWMLSNKG